MQLHGDLPEGFEPLKEVLREDVQPTHVTIDIPPDGIEELAKPINNWIKNKGDIPKLGDIMARRVDGVAVKLKS